MVSICWNTIFLLCNIDVYKRQVQLAAVGNTLPVALDGAFKFSQLGITAVAETIWEAQTAYAFNPVSYTHLQPFIFG